MADAKADKTNKDRVLSASKLYYPYRLLGLVTDGVPFVVNRLGDECFLTVSIGKAFQIFRCDHLRLALASPPAHVKNISCLAARGDTLTFAGCGNEILLWKRLECLGTIGIHRGSVVNILCIGDVLVSVCNEGELKVWQTGRGHSKDPLCSIILPHGFVPTCMVHPPTYLNKVVVGSECGTLGLWNIRTGKCVHLFKYAGKSKVPITCLEPSPALDVLAIGRADGCIHLVNMKTDMLLFSLEQAGPVLCLSFRTDLGSATLPMLVSGSVEGKLHIWDLKERRLHHSMRCHEGRISACSFLPREPVLVTSSPDNSIRMWVFDAPDGTARLLRSREGHRAPPSRIRYYGTPGNADADANSAEALCILSGSMDRSLRLFHTVRDCLSTEFSSKPLLKASTKHKVVSEGSKLRPIVALDSCGTRESDWCNIVTCHEGDTNVYVWMYKNRCIGKHILRQATWENNVMMHIPNPKNVALSVNISACGNYAMVGTRGGAIYKYNIQSGLPRGSYPVTATTLTKAQEMGKTGVAKPSSVSKIFRIMSGKKGTHEDTQLKINSDEIVGHTGAVQGIVSDAFNKVMASGGLDGKLIFWDFAVHALLGEVDVGIGISQLELSRESGLIAAACDDFTAMLFDLTTRKLVRRLSGHSGAIADMGFTADARRLITASTDATLRVWDLPTGKCVDWLKFAKPVTSVTVSPSGEFLATSHQDRVGLSIWADRSFFQPVYLDSVPLSPCVMDEPAPITEDSTTNTQDEDDMYNQDKRAIRGALANDVSSDAHEKDTSHETSTKAVHGADGRKLITLSGLSRAYWASLFHLELIKERNKPSEAPKKPEAAPFFLPVQHRGGAMEPSFFEKSAEEFPEQSTSTPKPENDEHLNQPDPSLPGWGDAWSDDDDQDVNQASKNKKRKHPEEEHSQKIPIAVSKIMHPDKSNKKRKKGGAQKDNTNVNESDNKDVYVMDAEDRAQFAAEQEQLRRLRSRCKLAEILMSKGKNGAVNSKHKKEKYALVMEHLTKLGPSAVDIEMRALCTDEKDKDGIELLLLLLDFFVEQLKSRMSFDVVQAYLNRFLKVHATVMMASPELQSAAVAVQSEQRKATSRLQQLIQENLCLVQYLSDLH